MEWIRNHEVLAVFVPYVSLLVLVFLGILVFVNKSGGRARKRAREKYASCVGRAIARITERREVSKYVGTDSETGHSEYRDSVVVTYEFEVDGQTYQGNGEYSTLKKKITELEVCYDPAN
ncbi:MAG: hypothetical protein J5546_10920, partial [Lachnospiraceae bacterium]|nr:hypothetical protein [Lachnospiraceae bacterium]